MSSPKQAIDAQLASPFFSKLPPELRTAIYVLLFGGERVHLEFMTHPTRADKFANRKRWRHSICEQDRTVPFAAVVARTHYCLTAARRRVLDVGLLSTCRRAQSEGVPVLYQSNMFLIVNSGSRRRPADDLRSLQVKIPRYWPLIRSLEIKWDVAAFDRNHANMVPHVWGREGYEAFWDALAEMPALAHLRVAIQMPRSLLAAEVSAAELRDLYLGPIERVKSLQTCQIVMPSSYRPFLGMEEDSFTQGAKFTISWSNDDDVSSAAAAAHFYPFLRPTALISMS